MAVEMRGCEEVSSESRGSDRDASDVDVDVAVVCGDWEWVCSGERC